MSFFHSFEFFATRFDIERLVTQIHDDLGCNLSGFTHLGQKGRYEETPLQRISLEQALGPEQDRFTSYLFRTEDTPLPEGTAPEHDSFDVAKVTLFKYPQFLQPHVAARYKLDADFRLIEHMFDHSMGRPTPKNEKTQALWKLILSLVKRRARYPLYTAFWERDGRSYLFQTSFVCTADAWRLFRAGGFIEKEKPSRWADFVPEPPPWWDGVICPKVPHNDKREVRDQAEFERPLVAAMPHYRIEDGAAVEIPAPPRTKPDIPEWPKPRDPFDSRGV